MRNDDHKKRGFLNFISIMKVFFVLGSPASGKSTFCKELTDYIHIALGDLLRKEAVNNSNIWKCMQSGNLIPSEITISILKKALDNGNNDCLIDGFPRNLENVRLWDEKMGIEPSGLIFLDCPENICMQRLLKRKRCDDTMECIKKRFLSFKRETIPVIKHYEIRNIPIYDSKSFRDLTK